MTAKNKTSEPEVSKPEVSRLEAFFRWKKETPGTQCYQQVDPRTGEDERTPIGTLYVKKDALLQGVPSAIKVTIEFAIKSKKQENVE